MIATTTFEDHRGVLFGVAYRMLGVVMDAEDVVQDAWLRWRDVDHDAVADPKAYLVRIVTRLSIDRLRKARTRRETYVGEWLPEPILTASNVPGTAQPDVAEDVARADTVAYGLLVVLESLSPLERAVFVLREAFDFSYDEIAEMLDRRSDAVRQLSKRAHDHVRERRARFDIDRETQSQVTAMFLAATSTGDVSDLLALLAPDVVLHSDGGGIRKAPVRSIGGADKVGRFLAAIAQQAPPDPTVYLAPVNGGVALVVLSGGTVDTVFSLDVIDGRITAMHMIANPEKLRGMAAVASVGSLIETPRTWE